MAVDPDDIQAPFPPGVDHDESRQGELIGWASAMMVLSALAVALRIFSRYLVKNKFHSDDWLAFASLPFAWMMCLISIYGALHDHFGQHLGHSTLGSIRHYLIGLWVFDFVYGFAITLSKLSIMALWWRIFEVKSCHVALGVLAALEVAWLTGATFTTIFSCVPVRGFWDKTIQATCLVQSKFWLGTAVPNIIFDVALLIIPNFYVARLAISRSQKLGLIFMFMLGILVTICSILRLWQLILYNNEVQTDVTWATSPTAIWSFVEGNLSVVCCCLPSMRPILRLVVHGRAATTGRDYMSNRNSMRSPGASGVFSKRGSRVNPVPMQRLSVGISKKTEWWETTQTQSTNNDAHGDGGESGLGRGRAGAPGEGRAGEPGTDSWPLPNTLPMVSTTIYAGERPPNPALAPAPAITASGKKNPFPENSMLSAGQAHDRSHSRNRSLVWSGWLDNKLSKPVPGAHTWLQLDDSVASDSPRDSPGETHTRQHEHEPAGEYFKGVEAGEQHTRQPSEKEDDLPVARRSSDAGYVRPGTAQ